MHKTVVCLVIVGQVLNSVVDSIGVMRNIRMNGERLRLRPHHLGDYLPILDVHSQEGVLPKVIAAPLLPPGLGVVIELTHDH